MVVDSLQKWIPHQVTAGTEYKNHLNRQRRLVTTLTDSRTQIQLKAGKIRPPKTRRVDSSSDFGSANDTGGSRWQQDCGEYSLASTVLHSTQYKRFNGPWCTSLATVPDGRPFSLQEVQLLSPFSVDNHRPLLMSTMANGAPNW